MTVVQVLTVNLLTDGLPGGGAVARSRLAGRRSGGRADTARLFPRRLQLALVLMGIAVGLPRPPRT